MIHATKIQHTDRNRVLLKWIYTAINLKNHSLARLASEVNPVDSLFTTHCISSSMS